MATLTMTKINCELRLLVVMNMNDLECRVSNLATFPFYASLIVCLFGM